MPQYQYANKNVLKLGAALSTSSTTLTVVSGSDWPALATGQQFQLTLMDAATGAVTEIVSATVHAAGSNQLAITRAQEGTTAKAFAVGDYAVIMMTQTVWNNFKQFLIPELEATASFSTDTTNNRWYKVATMTMPQSSSTANIKLYGGSGFNAGQPTQAAIVDIVIRAGNSNPVSWNVVAYISIPTDLLTFSTSLPLKDIAVVNTSGNTIDVYIQANAYTRDMFLTAQCTSNAQISALGNLGGFAALPPGAIKGVVYANQLVDINKPQGTTRWVLHNSAEAAEWFALAGNFNAAANGELMIGIGDNTLKIRGIIRGTMASGAVLANITNKRPYGCTIANLTYSHVWPSNGVPVLANGGLYTERANSTGAIALALANGFPSGGSWVMVNIDIEYY